MTLETHVIFARRLASHAVYPDRGPCPAAGGLDPPLHSAPGGFRPPVPGHHPARGAVLGVLPPLLPVCRRPPTRPGAVPRDRPPSRPRPARRPGHPGAATQPGAARPPAGPPAPPPLAAGHRPAVAAVP